MYAIFKAKGKQFRAEPDRTLRLPSLDAEPGETVTFEEVLLGGEEGEIAVGTPALRGASVQAEVVRHGRGEKIVVFKMKRRKNYRRKQGHRQKFTEIRILRIDLGSGPSKPKRRPTKEAPEVEAEPAVAAEAVGSSGTPAAEPPETADVDITPAARQLAEEHDLDLSGVEGTGVEGRILKSDVEKAIKARDADG